ncbi:hypothetical protein [Jeotgalibacillus aurantiacus]|uniref:hypothetical protein n=1 Tax=Jeotgalibacillus aurantiacus TaxID=2763266 RepID=UPI001D0A2C4A|nr:hypothetical protein [Jeotgalibacillus aurantiacus]
MSKTVKLLLSSGLALVVLAGSYSLTESSFGDKSSNESYGELQIAAPKGDYKTEDHNHVNRPPGY